jgi:glyoxylase-like metal-dependent hydrolase (beta-lactamase superfamily II)
VRAVTLPGDVLVATSQVWQTTCTTVRRGDEVFVIDSPVYPDELELLPGLLQQAGFAVSALIATHGDWDHLLGRLAFPGATVAVAETTAARLRREMGGAQRELRAFDDRHYVERPQPLALDKHVEAVPVPGHLGIGDADLDLLPADGHTEDGMAIWVPWAKVLIAGDYLSPVELPVISPGGSRSAYLATLRRLEPYVEQAGYVVPGHGAVMDGARAAAVLREDRAYLEALPDATLPLARRGPAQQLVHKENVARV